MEVDSVGTLRVEGAPLSSRVDTLFWQDRFNRFRKVHLETYNNHLTAIAEDSLLNRAEPAFRFRAWGQDEDVPNEIELYWKAPISDTYETAGSSTNGMDRGCTPSTRTKPCSCSDSYSTRCSRGYADRHCWAKAAQEKRAFQVAMLAASTGSALKAERMASVKACTSLGGQM